MSGWALYEAWVGAQTAQQQADALYGRAVAAGPGLDADSPEAVAAQEAEHDAGMAWQGYDIARGVDPDPEATQEAYAEAVDQENRGAAWDGPFPGTSAWYVRCYGPEAAGLGSPERVSEPEPEAGG